ncbi:hypothetical protein DFH08DRAFT_799087 [Mycena albidolilacea]|uniref:Uncharacterized protein n=1 Tax=Mycena albidolilacea TaxID=1033008 RepID=A0AAD7AQC8_9AGAR|nr:hypothetical protein DFH08DRAFT_799087 [Mycena albidolilacea]
MANQLPSDDPNESEDKAQSTIGAASSSSGPDIPDIYLPYVPFSQLDSDDLPPEDDSDKTYGNRECAAKTTDLEKACTVLQFMKEHWPRFSLKDFLTVIFPSKDPRITVTANSYLATGGHSHLLCMVAENKATLDEDIYVSGKLVTSLKMRGPHLKEVLYLQVPADTVTVQHLQSFSLPKFLDTYEQTPGLKGFSGHLIITQVQNTLHGIQTW